MRLFSKALILSVVLKITLLRTCTALSEDECNLCNQTAGEFHDGLRKTTNHNFGGGNTDWEERRLGTYARSETRLLTILEEYVCTSKDDHKCHHFIEKHESDIEDWWFNVFSSDTSSASQLNNAKSLRSFLCVDTLKLCCAEERYGEHCEEQCTDNTCSHHGKCKVDGTRSLAARKCECDETTTGANCEICIPGRFQRTNPDGSFDCERCSPTCLTCSREATNCEQCTVGYELVGPTNVCVDVDECAASASVCDSFGDANSVKCVNTAGSYRCECADGYLLDSESSDQDEDDDDDDDGANRPSEKNETTKCVSVAEISSRQARKLSASDAVGVQESTQVDSDSEEGAGDGDPMHAHQHDEM